MWRVLAQQIGHPIIESYGKGRRVYQVNFYMLLRVIDGGTLETYRPYNCQYLTQSSRDGGRIRKSMFGGQ